MLMQIILGIVFIALPLTFTFALPLIQGYFSNDSAFNGALDDCETIFRD